MRHNLLKLSKTTCPSGENGTTSPFVVAVNERAVEHEGDDKGQLTLKTKSDHAERAPKSLLSKLMSEQHMLPPLRSLMIHRMFRSPERADHVVKHSSSWFSKPRTCLVYLIRHGEASHNVIEKQAERLAKEQAEAEGLGPEEVKTRMEEARKAVLTDEGLRDACLSELGHQDALKARSTLEALLKKHCWCMPRKVLVSPLTRTLQTADIIFHQHDTICVHEEIQERQTGQPCDSRQSSTQLSKNFQRFKMHAMGSFYDDSMFLPDGDENDESSSSTSCQEDFRVGTRQWKSESSSQDARYRHPDSMTFHRTISVPLEGIEENKAELRQRTRKLLALLNEPSVAVVTHKGYLRELERGTLGQPDAKEFANGEIRVYRIHLDAHQELEKAARVV